MRDSRAVPGLCHAPKALDSHAAIAHKRGHIILEPIRAERGHQRGPFGSFTANFSPRARLFVGN
jgi:hypothetical protein